MSSSALDKFDKLDKKHNRFSDKEKNLLFKLFTKYQSIIDIKQRRSLNWSHKQSEIRACWNTILGAFNSHPDTNNRTIKQIHKFWLNSKLRNRLPSDSSPTPSTSKLEVKKFITIRSNSLDSFSDKNNEIELEFVETIDPEEQHFETAEDIKELPIEEEEVELQEITTKNVHPKIVHRVVRSNRKYRQTSSNRPVTIQIVPAIPASSTPIKNNYEKLPEDRESHFQANQTNSTLRDTENKITPDDNPEDHEEQSKEISIHEMTSHNDTEITFSKYDVKMNALRMQEIECRIRESKLRCELQQIAIKRANEELIQMQELHQMTMKERQVQLERSQKGLTPK